MIDLDAAQRDAQLALREDLAAVRLRRDVIRATGADTVSYLQGQLSQDMGLLTPEAPLQALILEPGGKVDAWLRVWGRGDDEVLIDVEAGAGPALLARLNRFRLRVAVDFELLDWQLVAIRGPQSAVLDPTSLGAELAAVVDWAGLAGVDLLGPDVAVPAGVVEVDPTAFDVIRIEAGQPAMGSELGPDLEPLVIPAEAGEWLIDQSVSFTKGCYTGQELVARVDSRGSNTPRKLRGVVATGGATPPAGAAVVVDGEVRGTLTSVGRSAALDAPVALAYVHRSVEPSDLTPVPAIIRWTDDAGDREEPAEVRVLPLVGVR